MGAGAPPGDFVAEVCAAEDGVHEDAQPCAFGVVAVQVDAAGGLEDAAHFDEALPHEGEVGLGARADHFAGGGDDVADGFAVFKQALQHCLIQVVEGEGVFEGVLAGGGDQLFEIFVGQVGVVRDFHAGGAGVFGAERPLVFAAAVEGRVEVDEVDGFAVDAFEAGQVVADVDGAVAEIHGGSVGPAAGRWFSTVVGCGVWGCRGGSGGMAGVLRTGVGVTWGVGAALGEIPAAERGYDGSWGRV